MSRDRPAVGGQLDLPRVLLGGFLVRLVPLDLLVRDDLYDHAMVDAPLGARRDQVAGLGDVVLGDDVAGFDIGPGGCKGEQPRKGQAAKHCTSRRESHLHPQLANLRPLPLLFSSGNQ
jgi:hypothetical protein